MSEFDGRCHLTGINPHASLTSQARTILSFSLTERCFKYDRYDRYDRRHVGRERGRARCVAVRRGSVSEMLSLLLLVRAWRGPMVGKRHGNRRNRTVVAASYGVVVPDDPIAISIRLSRPAAAAGMPGLPGVVTVDDRNRAAHALPTRRSTALPWRRRRL